MGERLANAFVIAKDLGGLSAQMRLSIKTLMSNQQALSEPDSKENVVKFRKVLLEILEREDIPEF
jgi:hypothetical protein